MAENSKFNNIVINKELLNDTMCKNHKNKIRPYSKYCKICDKDLCNWCSKAHIDSNHEVIDLDLLGPNEDLFNNLQLNLEKMELLKNNLKNLKKPEILIKLENLIKELNGYLENINKKIDSNINEFYNILNFNTEIIEAFKQGKKIHIFIKMLFLLNLF